MRHVQHFFLNHHAGYRKLFLFYQKKVARLVHECATKTIVQYLGRAGFQPISDEGKFNQSAMAIISANQHRLVVALVIRILPK
jgi:hypothetical protein